MKLNFKNRIKDVWSVLGRGPRNYKSSRVDRRTILIFVVCLLIAFCLWMVINLNQNYNINLQLPLESGEINTKQALAQKLPHNIIVTVTGKGWSLIKLYQNPPAININVTGQQINLLPQVRQAIDNQNVSVQKVIPYDLQPKLVPKQTKKVPVRANVRVQFKKQYGFLHDPVITPDSVTVSGASSQIKNIHQWPTDSLSLSGVQKDLSKSVSLRKPGPLVQVSPNKVGYHAKVVKLTSDEVTVPITKLNFPGNRMVTLIPSSLTITYEVPLKEYEKVKNSNPFKAVITYQQLKKDSTGFLKPQIKQTIKNVHLKIRAIQPSVISYFTVIGNGNMMLEF